METWKLHGPISDSCDEEPLFTSSPSENPLDWTCEELKGRATALFFPLTDGEILVQEGDVVVITEQTLAGDYFLIHNKRTGQSGKVPVDYIEIIPEDVDQVPLPVRNKSDQTTNKRGQSLHRQLGVSRRKGVEVRQRMSATFTSTDTPEQNGDHSVAQASTFPRLAKPTTTTAPSSAQSLTAVSSSPSTKAHRSTTMLPNISETGDVRRDSRSATVAMATGGGATGEQDPVDDVVEYEEGFKMVEKYNIISVSGLDRDGRPVIVISACLLPAFYAINHDVLLRYGKYFLDKIVEQDYTLLYCHYGLRSYNKPSLSWLRKVYGEMDRKYKKNIKKVYIVHPTNFIRVMLSLMKPFLKR